jgi:serine/threonine protein kinase
MGNSGFIYKALNATTGEVIAVKQVKNLTSASNKHLIAIVNALKRESETLKDLDHPNIVQYFGFEETPNFLSM